MSTRRAPLSSNPNAANSPLRGALAKHKRSYANAQREEPYGQPPPLKRQMLDNGRNSKTQTTVQRGTVRPTVKERPVQNAVPADRYYGQGQEDNMEAWTKHHKARFPKIVFYFESVPDDVRLKVAKQVATLGAREEKFFSINITHVITTRSIPAAERERDSAADTTQDEPEPEEQPQTINPSLLDRSSDARRRYLLDPTARRLLPNHKDGPVTRAKPARSTDVLHKARDMGKKIWSLDKLQRMLLILLEDGQHGTAGASTRIGNSRSFPSFIRDGDELQQLLQNERLNGPSDRDPTVVSRELTYFKGYYVYVYDIDEKQKPIMVREYQKVANKFDGDWPQFRSVSNGRCPFVEDVDNADKESRKKQAKEREKEKEKAAKDTPVLQPPEIPPPRPVTGKRTLSEMEDAHNRNRGTVQSTDIFDGSKALTARSLNLQQPQKAFTGRHGHGRLFAGEPGASGVQPSNVTSAIRSNMISSTSGLNGAKAGTSKEVHGLQRKVLQKGAPTSHDLSSRRLTEMSLENPSSRSVSLSRANSRRMETVEEDVPKEKKTAQVQAQAPPPKSKADLKPCYCENCGDKFRDFDEHIVSRKHRKFAENRNNWYELDELLAQVKRTAKFASSPGTDDAW